MTLYFISLFIMHSRTFVLIEREEDIETAVSKALAPFDESLRVAPYRVHFSKAEVEQMAAHFKIPPGDLHALAAKMPQWRSSPGGVDRRGLYELCPYNPDGWWDWYRIGGRWNGCIPGAKRNVISAEALANSEKLSECLPHYIVTPAGEWIEYQRFYLDPDWEGGQWVSLTEDERLSLTRSTLLRFRDHLVVCVDTHS